MCTKKNNKSLERIVGEMESTQEYMRRIIEYKDLNKNTNLILKNLGAKHESGTELLNFINDIKYTYNIFDDSKDKKTVDWLLITFTVALIASIFSTESICDFIKNSILCGLFLATIVLFFISGRMSKCIVFKNILWLEELIKNNF